MTLKERYIKEIALALQKELNIKNIMEVPRITKIKVNVGIGSYMQRHKDYNDVVKNITKITGQKPVVVNSKIAISNFKLKIGMPVGASVTLRKDRMYHFFDKLVNIVFPRLRDFRGFLKKSFDGKGNYNIGIRDYTVFPEINLEDVTKDHGIQVSISTTAKNDEEGALLLEKMGFPFKKNN